MISYLSWKNVLKSSNALPTGELSLEGHFFLAPWSKARAPRKLPDNKVYSVLKVKILKFIKLFDKS